jgi:hypothetical protein
MRRWLTALLACMVVAAAAALPAGGAGRPAQVRYRLAFKGTASWSWKITRGGGASSTARGAARFDFPDMGVIPLPRSGAWRGPTRNTTGRRGTLAGSVDGTRTAGSGASRETVTCRGAISGVPASLNSYAVMGRTVSVFFTPQAHMLRVPHAQVQTGPGKPQAGEACLAGDDGIDTATATLPLFPCATRGLVLFDSSSLPRGIGTETLGVPRARFRRSRLGGRRITASVAMTLTTRTPGVRRLHCTHSGAIDVTGATARLTGKLTLTRAG